MILVGSIRWAFDSFPTAFAELLYADTAADCDGRCASKFEWLAMSLLLRHLKLRGACQCEYSLKARFSSFVHFVSDEYFPSSKLMSPLFDDLMNWCSILVFTNNIGPLFSASLICLRCCPYLLQLRHRHWYFGSIVLSIIVRIEGININPQHNWEKHLRKYNHRTNQSFHLPFVCSSNRAY